MKRLATTLALLAICAAPAFAANPVRISQVYGGGGGTGSTTTATWSQDYVELFNFSASAVNIGGWSIEYGSATGLWASSSSNLLTFPAGTMIQPCSYILVALGQVAANPATPAVPSPDFSNTTTNMSGTNGKVGLFSATNSNVACGSELPGTLVDKVGYGSGTAICAETAPTAVLSTTSGAVRNSAGMTDTDNNSADFTVVSNPTPRNSHTPPNASCLITPTRTSTWGRVKAIYR